MNTYIIKGTHHQGPYSIPEILTRLKNGQLSATDLGWQEGLATAIPLSEILAEEHRPTQYAPEDLLQIASRQKTLIWVVAVLVTLTYLPLPIENQACVYLACLALHILGVTTTCKLAHALKHKVCPWALATAFPIANLVAFSQITTEAAVILRVNGIRCGVLGVSRKEMQRFGCPGPNAPTEIWKPSEGRNPKAE